MNVELAGQVNQLTSLLPQLSTSDKEFALDLIHWFHKKGNLSVRQAPWVGKLIERATTPKPEPVKIDVGEFAAVIALFQKAKEHLKYPKIVLQCAGLPITLSLAGQASKVPGSINIAGEGKYPNRVWYGRVLADGKWNVANGVTPEMQQALIDLLKEFGADPAGVAKKYGQLTGNCCFCNSPLHDVRSTAAGFGPVCAKNYGLQEEWKTAVKKAEESKEVFEEACVQVNAGSSVAPFTPDVVEAVKPEQTTFCFLCDDKPAEMEKNGYKICGGCAHQLEM